MIIVSLKRLRFAVVCILIILLPFMMYVKIGGRTVNLSYADMLLPLAFLLTFIHPKRIGDWRIRKYNSYLKLLLLIMLASVVNIIKWGNYGASFRAYLLAFMKFVICYAYVMVFNRFFEENEESIDKVLNIFIFSTTIDAALAYYGILMKMMGRNSSFVYQNSFRASGSFSDPNLFACFMFIGLYMTIHSYHKSGNNKYLIALFVQMGAIILSASKAAIIALAFCIVWGLWGLVRNSNRRIKISSILLIALVIAVFAFLISRTDVFTKSFNRFYTLLNSDEDITTGRFTIWSRSSELIKNSPILGVGLGLHNIAASQLLSTVNEFVFHNTYLNYIVELGVFGLIWMIYALLGILRNQHVYLNNTHNYSTTGFLVAILFMVFTLDLENFRSLWVFFGLLLKLTTESFGDNNGEVSQNI